ncbi:hypothetical protein [Marilutibacter chinensis]|uniref:Glycosyltransferase n=1 Tax=Marilutibacter chinensis TaxID=2912247 RepID=A0ABS9HRJ5_9GAMM|nr:hypothetical protein [Lysobacter chinensis]MCF7221559.1 hypothetical protein [Lysobacter chinensis]
MPTPTPTSGRAAPARDDSDARGEGATGRIVFVPVSGGPGSGEVQRCRLLADALASAHPGLEPHFLLAEGTPPLPWPTTVLGASPTRAVAEVVAAIATLQPAVVVFDGNTRVAALEAARRAGARVVLVSSRPSARDRGFRWRRMARLDEHWLVGADLMNERGLRERLGRWRHPQVEVRRFATLFTPPAALEPVLHRLGLAQPYAVVCHGGGRHLLGGRSAAGLFAEIASASAHAGLATLAVAAPARSPALQVDALPNAELMAVLAGAEAALLGGGSLLVQALALGTPVLALPLQAEQAARVGWLEDAGAVMRADPTADAGELAAALRALADSDSTRARLRDNARGLGLGNGLPAAVEALATLAVR